MIPTDTIYGLVGSALNKKTVERIYKLRGRNLKKPMIILIGSIGDLKNFGVAVDSETMKQLKKFWPGKVSVILQMENSKLRREKFEYLHRGTRSLAFRLPKPHWLKKLLIATGPLVAPSANWEGKPPAYTIREAKKYFGNKVDFYVDGGRLFSGPSTLIKIQEGKIAILRKGVSSPRLQAVGL